MTPLDLTSYSRESLENMLSIVKSYRTSLKQIGKRAVLIDPKHPPAISATVEYVGGMHKDSVEKYALSCMKKLFPEYTGAAPILRENPELKWWIRVFVGDDMIDLTFQKFETLIK